VSPRGGIAVGLLAALAGAQEPVAAPSPRAPEAALRQADAAAAAAGLARHDFVEVHFGNIPVELSLYAADAERARAAARAAFARIAELAAMMDDYALDPPSPLNRIAAEAPAAVEVPPELFEALERAVDHHRLTAGAFDISAKPFVQLWRVSRRLGELPPADRLRRARDFVDLGALELEPGTCRARLRREGMWLDLGGLAKGQIGDEVVRLLEERGLPICRYHAGGDMVFGAAPPGLPGWPVHVTDLAIDGEALAFWASGSAASVSGDLFRFVEIDGRRYAHVIDPRTGLGVTERRIACVRGLRGIDTDPLATAGLILDEAEWRDALAGVPGCRGWVARIGAVGGAAGGR
jgi:thiamine biosynthesis lipoprotein